uniref:Gag-Pol polyprotein n=1 Tax=Tanacetum cinerariifolium TaxID=118510 RepID=A0A699H8J3_TANCI|nr:Gag-Pol polyprotein [Tanacetum cinerariifolium]
MFFRTTLVFDDVTATSLEEESRCNNMEDKQTNSTQVEDLVVTRGRSMEPGSSVSHNHAVANESRKRFVDVWLFDTGATFHMTARRECNMASEALVSEQGMKILVERKLLPGLVKVSLPLCEHCVKHRVISKKHRLKFKTSNYRSVYVLELVHSEVWQAPVQSLGGVKYFVSFIDDYSRRCWVYPIKKKSDVFEVYKVYKAQIELDFGKKIKCLRTNNGDYVMERNVAHCLLTKEGEPLTLQEALNNPDAAFWKEAMQEEIKALRKNKTWKVVPLPGGRKPIGNK